MFKRLLDGLKGFGSFVTSTVFPFGKSYAKESAPKGRGFVQSAVLGSSIFIGRLAMGPVGAVGLGVGMHLLQNRSRNRRFGQTAITAGATAAGVGLGAGLGASTALLLGPLGIFGPAIGAAAGGLVGQFAGERIGNAISNPLTPAGRFRNAFSRGGDALSSALNTLTIPIRGLATTVAIGCGCLVVFIVAAIVTILAIFVIPKSEPATFPPGSPPPAISCFKFDNTWGAAPDQRGLVETALNTLLQRYSAFTNLICRNLAVTFTYDPTVSLCGFADGATSTIHLRSYNDCYRDQDKQSFATSNVAHELTHFIQQSLFQQFQSIVIDSGEGELSPPYPRGLDYLVGYDWHEGVAESVAVYVRCTLYGTYCDYASTHPKHMEFVRTSIGVFH